jgi:cytochrome c553
VRATLPFLVLLGLTACGPTTNRTGEAFSASGELIAWSGGEGGAANACFRCHGREGQGDGTGAPRLAGMDVGYLQKQLDDYAGGLRKDDVMGPVAKWLSVEDRRAVAAWYAAMPPPAGGAISPAPTVYAAKCAVCHGRQGQGVGSANPALAGQPAAYTLDQLTRWKKAGRRNDPGEVMTAAVSGLSEPDLRAIAAWLERQPASPRPDSDAATLSAAGRAWEELAASRGTRRPGR